ncbi:RsmB/NOP family class I SAM-dependent RNA methyltransferase [Paracoccaceae bacterium GXU_MW_L88]
MENSAAGLAARRGAAELLAAILLEEQSMGDAITVLDDLPPPEKARARSLALTVLRHLGRIDGLLQSYLKDAPPPAPLMALRIAVAEMLVEEVAPHAAVDQAVALTRDLGAPGMSGLVNAVARKISREGPAKWAKLPPSHLPAVLAGPIKKAWGKPALKGIEAAHERGAPLDITVKSDAEGWAERLGGTLTPTGSVRLSRAQVTALPGYDDGDWWVQDAGAALPAQMVPDLKGARVLDLCAAPGGKTMQMVAMGAEVTAVDSVHPRLRRMQANLDRTGLDAEMILADATEWTPGGAFDLILLDAPCSATGTIRRHPELPFLKDLEDIRPLLELQKTLLTRAAGWLKPGGDLIYCVCSLLPAEGEKQVAASDLTARETALCPDWQIAPGQIRARPDYWPEIGGIDGFFMARLTV